MNRINLNTTYPIKSDGPVHALPVLVDLNWLGRIMTRPDAGIIRSSEFIGTLEVVL